MNNDFTIKSKEFGKETKILEHSSIRAFQDAP